MKLYGVCTPSHAPLRERWFRATLQDDLEVVILELDGEGDGRWLSDGWWAGIDRKIELFVEAVRENIGETLLFSDMDVQFFRPVVPLLLDALGEDDMAFQSNTSAFPEANTGFLVCRAGAATLRFWEATRTLCRERPSGRFAAETLRAFGPRVATRAVFKLIKHRLGRLYEQDAANILLATGACGVRWSLLPDRFFCPGRMWRPGDRLEVPENVVMHHANWCVGVEHKLRQLEYVREVVASRDGAGR
jgi:hypothetical protein